ncbi:hypothetical protein EDB83DRAFT_2315240 [Lactarius deliciosus]|nr:hypothetical protein EDB83DRAFT_2315240 [Lactarius deliciosus]
MALELTKHNPVYEDIASKCDDIPDGEDKHSLWNEHDVMYYDAVQWGGHSMQLPPNENRPEVSGRNSKHESSWPWRALLTRTRKDRLHQSGIPRRAMVMAKADAIANGRERAGTREDKAKR